MPNSVITPAHTQTVTLHVVEHVPSHEPRETDPHYRYFNAARQRLKDLGKLQCWICGTDQQIELHHSTVEFSLANGVDVTRFEEIYPEFGITTDEQFLEWIEGEGNLTPLCKLHHTGILGVHVLPYPVWLPQRFWQRDLDVPAECVPAGSTKVTIRTTPADPSAPVTEVSVITAAATPEVPTP